MPERGVSRLRAPAGEERAWHGMLWPHPVMTVTQSGLGLLVLGSSAQLPRALNRLRKPGSTSATFTACQGELTSFCSPRGVLTSRDTYGAHLFSTIPIAVLCARYLHIFDAADSAVKPCQRKRLVIDKDKVYAPLILTAAASDREMFLGSQGECFGIFSE